VSAGPLNAAGLILAEEADWLWLSKPAGLTVFPPHADPGGDCLLRRLLALRPEQGVPAFPEGFAGGLAHRLDTSTSGVVLAARGTDALARARDAFVGKRLVKSYRLLTAGDPPWRAHTVDAAVAHHKRRRGRMVVQRGNNTPHRGKWYPAETSFRRLKTGHWEAEMQTGVMHQIRVHAGFAGLALLGDRRYGGAHLPEGLAPEGVTFALHHVGFAGLSPRAPRLDPPPWWSGWAPPA